MLVVCNGMIRSGSTLQYNLTREVLARSAERSLVAHGFLPPKTVNALGDALTQWAHDETWHLLDHGYSLAASAPCPLHLPC